MKLVSTLSLIALCTAVSTVALASSSSEVTLQQFSSDDRAALDLDKLSSAEVLDQDLVGNANIDTETSYFGRGPRGVVRRWPGFAPGPVYFPTPVRIRPPFRVCYAENAYGQVFSASGYRSAGYLVPIALRSCAYSNNPVGCRPAGCR